MSHHHTSHLTNAQHRETAFELLSSALRRDVLAVLRDRRSPIGLDEIAEAVREEAASASETPSDPEKTRVALHHVHLPKLDDAGVVSYDPGTKTVTPERLDAIAPYVTGDRGEV